MGQLGRNTNTNQLPDESFIIFSDTVPAVLVAAGAKHTCALFMSGGMRCWGLGSDGQLGYGDVVNRGHLPGSMSSLPFIALDPVDLPNSIALGSYHTCAVFGVKFPSAKRSAVKCWGAGDNTYGQVGDLGCISPSHACPFAAPLAAPSMEFHSDVVQVHWNGWDGWMDGWILFVL